MRSLNIAVAFVLAALNGSMMAQPRVKGPLNEFGVLNGAEFRITIPANWNGGLVMYARGYVPPEIEFHVPRDEGTNAPNASMSYMIPAVGKLGYATAQSAYSKRGWAVEEGALETEALRKYFVGKYGRTYPTIISGLHMGGIIVYDMIERFGDSYDGALPMTGVGASSLEFLKEAMFDLRVVFDYYYPGLPGGPVSYPEGTNWSAMRAAIAKLVQANPARSAPLLRMFQIRDNDELVRRLNLYVSILKDLYVNRARGNAFDNTNTVYVGSDDDAKLNREIARYKSDPQAVVYVRQWSTISGRIRKPVLAVNSLHDAVVPVTWNRMFAEACARAGTQDLFVQMWMDQLAPNPDPQMLAFAFSALTDWIRNGRRPQPGPATDAIRAQANR